MPKSRAGRHQAERIPGELVVVSVSHEGEGSPPQCSSRIHVKQIAVQQVLDQSPEQHPGRQQPDRGCNGQVGDPPGVVKQPGDHGQKPYARQHPV